MNHELIFSLAGLMAMAGWAALLLSPLIPVWSDRIAGLVIPAALSVGYVAILLAFPAPNGGFGSFAEVRELFSHADALMAGWIHFLAFDLVVGAWICRHGRSIGMPFWQVAPCLPVTFLLPNYCSHDASFVSSCIWPDDSSEFYHMVRKTGGVFC